jgi:hypothetical protein
VKREHTVCRKKRGNKLGLTEQTSMIQQTWTIPGLTSTLRKPRWGRQVRSTKNSLLRYLAKLGIRNLSPHLRNSAILRTTKTIAELRTKKSYGTVIADLENLTSAIPQLSAVSCQSATFLSLFLSSGWF